jgi:hypothetical protein
LYYSKGSSRPVEVWKVPIGGGEETRVLDSIMAPGTFATADAGVYFIAPPDADGVYYLCFHDFASGETRQIATLPERPAWPLSVSADGRQVLYTGIEQSGSDLMLVENFR